ncbi:MAG: hypothetical protein PHW76_08105 [Alphaproteobacteria bacterium]|nr:hypothetical protein [Alphaproteobacteria bacterium]
MADQLLKDKRGFTIGKIVIDKTGKQTLKDAKGFTLGYYDPKTDKTRDAKGFIVGSGNLLAGLLTK